MTIAESRFAKVGRPICRARTTRHRGDGNRSKTGNQSAQRPFRLLPLSHVQRIVALSLTPGCGFHLLEDRVGRRRLQVRILANKILKGDLVLGACKRRNNPIAYSINVVSVLPCSRRCKSQNSMTFLHETIAEKCPLRSRPFLPCKGKTIEQN